jgi:hypothetical protein
MDDQTSWLPFVEELRPDLVYTVRPTIEERRDRIVIRAGPDDPVIELVRSPGRVVRGRDWQVMDDGKTWIVDIAPEPAVEQDPENIREPRSGDLDGFEEALDFRPKVPAGPSAGTAAALPVVRAGSLAGITAGVVPVISGEDKSGNEGIPLGKERL